MSFEIITDSSSNLPEHLIDQYGLHILSLVFRVGDQEYNSYIKGETTDLTPFYTMMRAGEEVKTSLINMEICTEVLENLLKEGKDILYVGFSSALSGTFQAVSMVVEELKEAYPERKIYAIDSLCAALGEGLLIQYAAKLREDGKDIEAVHRWILENRLNLCHWFTVDDLFFLKRGGRISQTSAVLGSLLSIKPVLHVDDEGRLIMIEKTRGRKKSLDALVDHMAETAIEPENQMVFISHGDCIEDAKYVENQVKERLHVKDVMCNILDPVIGAHSGPGTVALFYMGTKR